MKKGWIIAVIAVVIIALIVFLGFRWLTNNSNQPNNDSNYQASRTLAEDLNTRKSSNKSNS